MTNYKFTLKPRSVQSRDYSSHKTLGSVSGTLPDTVYLSPILDQGELDECTAYSAVATRYNELNEVFNPDIFWTNECEFAGVPTTDNAGFDIQVPAATAITKGFNVPNTSSPSAYFWVTAGGGQDLFQNICSAVFINQRPLMGGLMWYDEYTAAAGGIINAIGKSPQGGHCIKIAGFKTINGVQYLVLQNSWNTTVGDNGLFYMSRAVANQAFSPYGVFYWTDSTNTTVKTLGFITALYYNIISLLSFHKTGAYPPPTPHVSLIPALAAGIYEAEGNGIQNGIVKGYNNPGDIRGHSGNKYQKSLGVTGYGENNLAIFPDLAIGQKAVIQLCTDVANNLMLAYPKPCTIQQFAKIYADPQTQLEWNDYVAILLKNLPSKVANDTIASLL